MEGGGGGRGKGGAMVEYRRGVRKVKPNVKWISYMICGVAQSQGLDLKQGHITSSLIMDV